METLDAPSPPAAVKATPSQSSGLHTMAYYPEQLAALTSLASFQPLADSGLPESSPDGAIKPPAPMLPSVETRSIRRAETAAKIAPVAAPAASGPAQAATAPQEKSSGLFGMTVPGLDLVAPIGDYAGRWSAAVWGLGGKVAGFWR